MTLENAKVLYAHRLKLGKPVDDLLARYPELKDGEKTDPKGKQKEAEQGKADKEQPTEEIEEVKSDGKKPKG